MLNRLSILHVIAPGDAGGLESVVRLLAIGQRHRGHSVRVAAIMDLELDGCQRYLSSLEDAGVEVIRLPIPPRAYLRERASVGEVCSRYRPSVVHTHGYRPDVLHGDVARRLGVPTVTTVHGFCGGGLKNRFYERVQRVAFRRFDAVVAVCRPLAESLIASGVRRSHVHIVPNAFTSTATLDRRTARQQLSIPQDEFVLGWVGRLSREKGADVFVDALARLVDLPVTASVLGGGPEQERLRARARARGIGDRIRWHGVVPDAGSFFRAFDAFVLTSRTEGCPMVLFEAMAARVPIVASEVGGVPDVVSPAEGALVAPDNPSAVADAIRALHCNQERAAVRADAARDRLLSDFHLQPWLDRYQAIYTQLQAGPVATTA